MGWWWVPARLMFWGDVRPPAKRIGEYWVEHFYRHVCLPLLEPHQQVPCYREEVVREPSAHLRSGKWTKLGTAAVDIEPLHCLRISHGTNLLKCHSDSSVLSAGRKTPP